jgi:hypothetical protein
LSSSPHSLGILVQCRLLNSSIWFPQLVAYSLQFPLFNLLSNWLLIGYHLISLLVTSCSKSVNENLQLSDNWFCDLPRFTAIQ